MIQDPSNPWSNVGASPSTNLDGIEVPNVPGGDEDGLPWEQVASPSGELATDLPWSEDLLSTADLQAAPHQVGTPGGTADQLAQAKGDAEALAEGRRRVAPTAQPVPALPAWLANPPPDPQRVEWAATLLNFLAFMFLARVLGQLLVVVLPEPSWLPPMAEWYSGLLPYPLLLPCQFAILAVMAWANWKTMLADPDWWRPKARLAWGLAIFAALYAGGMLARYLISGQLHPERRFLPPGIIPILFHWVLAAYLAGLAWVFSKRESQPW